MNYLGRDISPVRHQVGDRFELNGQLREVVEVVPVGFDACGNPSFVVFSREVPDLSQVPALPRFGLRCLAAIAGVKL
jgi:hypothetical protein